MKLTRRAIGKDSLLGDERGLTTVEYVIILVLIAVMAIGVWKTFGNSIKTQVTSSSGAIDKLGDDSSTSTTTTTPAPPK
ncbi:MAG TPA: Flp family type IVb pilin [Polyangiaceae bacterium]|nr:Flp family type IVb pilin [Polyangiaceae bacterium]